MGKGEMQRVKRKYFEMKHTIIQDTETYEMPLDYS